MAFCKNLAAPYSNLHHFATLALLLQHFRDRKLIPPFEVPLGKYICTLKYVYLMSVSLFKYVLFILKKC